MKVLFVATVVKKHIMHFHIPFLELFKQMGWQTAVAAKNDYDSEERCEIPYCDAFFDLPFQRDPLHAGNLKAYRMLRRIIREGDFDLIHCHTPVGGMVARLAARDARRKGCRVFYTAHGFHFYRGAPLKNWLLYYPAEALLSRLTDVLITINREDFTRAKKLHAKHVEYIPGVGVDLCRFRPDPTVREAKRRELGLRSSDCVLLSVGELIARKNHALVLKAMAKLRDRGELENVRYLLCGDGALRQELEETARSLGLDGHVHFLGYRRDIPSICNCSDVFVFPSLQEGLPVALLEAMACGLPAICSRIRGSTDLIADGRSGIAADSTPDAFAEAVMRYRSDPALCVRFAAEAQKTAAAYDLEIVKREMRRCYEAYL